MNRFINVIYFDFFIKIVRGMSSFVHFCKKSMFNDDVAFDSLPCFFHQTLYEQSSMFLR